MIRQTLKWAVTAGLLLTSCARLMDGEFPTTFPEVVFPPDNPSTSAGIALGKKLFHDPLLSSDNSISCASCHRQEAAFGDDSTVSRGVGGALGSRNANPIVNVAWAKSLFWDGRTASLEEQARGPIENPLEMNESLPNVVNKLQSHSDYPGLFAEAFGSSTVTATNLARAIAQFERTLISANSRYDDSIHTGGALTVEESRGRDLFFSDRTRCFRCHNGILFTDDAFHNIGLDTHTADAGRQEVTNAADDHGKFKTPTLRNVEFSAPYMHDGRFSSLRQVLDFYDRRIQNAPNLSPELGNLRRQGLSGRDKDDLVAFLRTLTDRDFLQNPELRP